jgi:diadenosine tetraphosphate (Ap4A) HIT family hydrolase
MGSEGATNPNCPFCLKNNFFEGEIIARTPRAYLAANSFSSGNFLIIPQDHIKNPAKLPGAWWQDMRELLAQTPKLPADYNVSLNIGRQAGQTIKHLHFWIIPRAAGTPASGKGLASFIDDANQE